MRATYFLGLLAAGLIATAAVGCDGGDGKDGDNGDGGSGATGGGGGGGPGGGGNTGGGGGGTTGDGNDTPENATEIDFNSETQGNLDPIGQDVDWYKFTGVAGQKIVVQIQAKTENPTDPTRPDTVVTLFDEGQHQIAQNDDLILGEIHDSTLFTVLPADGTYYVQVSECNQVFGMCGDITEITDTSYTLSVGDINPAILVTEMTPGPTAYEYTGSPGMYAGKIVNGTFSAAPEVDQFTFTVPADVMVDPDTRALSNFLFFPAGMEGNGSSAAVERASIIDTATGMTVAQLTGALAKGGQIWAPLTPGGQYTLEVEHTAGAVDAQSFYFNWSFPEGSSYLLEKEIADPVLEGNNTLVQAEDLTPVQATDAVVYYVEGDLENAGQPVGLDYYRFDVTGYAMVQSLCSAWIYGSGLRDLTATVVDGNNADLGAATETEGDPAFVETVAVPAGQTTLALRISAASQEADVAGNFYRCIVVGYNQ